MNRKPENQAAYYEKRPPNCIAGFLPRPVRLDNVTYDGHGSTGIYPDGLVANSNIVFAIECKCGSRSHAITAISNQNEIWFHKNLVIAEKYFLECDTCHSYQLFFNRYLHGYNAEIFRMEGLNFSEEVESTESSIKNETIKCICFSCKNTSFEVFARLEYSADLFDEPLFEGREQEFFSWFTGVGKCRTCSATNLFIDFECA